MDRLPSRRRGLVRKTLRPAQKKSILAITLIQRSTPTSQRCGFCKPPTLAPKGLQEQERIIAMHKDKNTRKLIKLLENRNCRIQPKRKGLCIHQAFSQSQDVDGVVMTRENKKGDAYTMHVSDRSAIKPFLDHALRNWDIFFVASFAREASQLGYPTFFLKVLKVFEKMGIPLPKWLM